VWWSKEVGVVAQGSWAFLLDGEGG
jgi:hypothetical protein